MSCEKSSMGKNISIVKETFLETRAHTPFSTRASPQLPLGVRIIEAKSRRSGPVLGRFDFEKQWSVQEIARKAGAQVRQPLSTGFNADFEDQPAPLPNTKVKQVANVTNFSSPVLTPCKHRDRSVLNDCPVIADPNEIVVSQGMGYILIISLGKRVL